MFGFSCDILGDHALVGAIKGTGVVELSGTAYHYKAQTRSEWMIEVAAMDSSGRFRSKLAITIGVTVPIVIAILLVLWWRSYGEYGSTRYSERVSSVEVVEKEGGFTHMILGANANRGTGIDVSRRQLATDASDFHDDDDEEDIGVDE